jgi:hypothetical protein
MPDLMEKATVYLSKLEADRAAAMELSKEKALEALLIKAREEGFREAMEIFGLNVAFDVASDTVAVETDQSHKETDQSHKRRRRDIRQMIVKELSYSGKAMTTKQIAKAIDYLQERTELAVKRLESEGKLIRNSSGLWEVSVINGTSLDSVAAAAE